jgi:hypothetical protein
MYINNSKFGAKVKIIVIVCLALLFFIATIFVYTQKNLFQGKLTELKPSANEESNLKPDFVISDVDLRFVKSPQENFPYYQYVADVKIKNSGEKAYVGSDLYFNAGKDQENRQMLNNEDSINFEVGVVEIVREYPILLDKNIEENIVLTFNIDPNNLIQETNEKNNTYSITIYNSINNIAVVDASKQNLTLSWEQPTGINDLKYRIKYIVENEDFDINDNLYNVIFSYKSSFAEKIKWYLTKSNPYLLGAAVKWNVLDIDPEKNSNKYSANVELPQDKKSNFLFIIEDNKFAKKSDAVLINFQ